MKKHILTIFFICTVISTITGCESSSNATTFNTVDETNSEIIAEENTEDSDEIVDSINTFIELYNAYTQTPITNLVDIDIHDKTSEYYRTEFRTHAFANALAKHGSINENISINLIQYSQGFRIYVIADSYESIQEILEIVIKIYDPSINNEQLQSDVYDKIDMFKSGISFYINDVTGYYEITDNEKHSIMLDTSSVDFIK